MASDEIGFAAPIPVLRMFDVARAYEFYRDYLGFTVDWEHRFGDDFPLYAQVSRSSMKLHLSEHHGDGTPGTVVWIEVADVYAWQAELAGKQYRYAKPGCPEEGPAGPGFELADPSGNILRFAQPED
ncbi:glyoxalase superfamily protein [Nocardia altamirensis]|uniref:glyoxalase superfamily protein n=1 Tax=Nocardia altamirensis TaxID=472158 RepID=UPI001FE0E819|nr:glyoxalase superfamily protein [Nocardia altamirensis]